MTSVAGTKSDCLQQCSEAFASNLERTCTFAFAPAQIAYSVRRDQIMFDNAIFKITGKGGIDLEDFTKKPIEGVTEEVDRQWKEFLQRPEEDQDKLVDRFGVGYVEKTSINHPAIQDTLDALYESIILGSWTAFETLAGDAWVALVNNGSPELANKVSEAKKSREEEGYQSSYDIRTNLGEYLRDVRAYSFQKLYGIKTAYSVAMGKTKAGEIFATDGGRIVLLSALRNAITHSSGKVDKRFTDQAAMFPELQGVRIGDSLSLNGELVSQMRFAAMETGVAILNAIEEILSPQP